MQVDFIIVGQGLCGTFLSHQLLQAGKRVYVIDTNKPFSASKVASGVINPVTGRRIVRTWLIETLMPFAVEAYTQLGNLLQANFIKPAPIIDFHTTAQMHLAFADRLPHETTYLHQLPNEQPWKDVCNYHFGAGMIAPSWLVDLQLLLPLWRQHLQLLSCIDDTHFDQTLLQVSAFRVQYKNVTAKAIIFCDGVQGSSNPFFQQLPFALNKGEALIIHAPQLPATHILKHGLSIVPWIGEGMFWVGSTYEWTYTDVLPSTAFREKTETALRQFLQHPFTIVEHLAAERPATIERRPFVGLHPLYQNVGILNGMGTKGCTLAPYFAHQLAQHLVHQAPIDPHANVQRFSKILSK